MRILACGDIHTKTWIIDEVEKIIDNYDTVVFVGDYADDWGADGLESIDTWHKLYMFQQKYSGKVKLVLGNHDFIYVNRTPSLQSGYNPVTQLAINSPANRYLKDWLLSLPVVLEEEGITFSHAGIIVNPGDYTLLGCLHNHKGCCVFKANSFTPTSIVLK